MTNLENSNPPRDDQIISLLESLRPSPSEEFHKRMAATPWETTRSAWNLKSLWGIAPFSWLKRLYKPALITLAFLLVLVTIFSLPPLQGTAKNILRYFVLADSDNLEINMLSTQSPEGEIPLTIVEVENLAGFSVKQSTKLPGDFALGNVSYNPVRNAVILDYHAPGSGRLLRITQTSNVSTTLEIGNIGARADVQIVHFKDAVGNEITGEYVSGAWKLPLMASTLESGQPDLTATMRANWDPSAKIHMLRWQSDGMLHEIIHGDESLPTLRADILITIAESMK
jgi:hypothetical protein